MEQKTERGYRSLIVWQEAKKFTLRIYGITAAFPQSEQFHMTNQMRRAASSIMANIAEGSAMPTKAHRQKFYYHARGSCSEVDNFVELSFALSYISNAEYTELCDHAARLRYLLTRLIEA